MKRVFAFSVGMTLASCSREPPAQPPQSPPQDAAAIEPPASPSASAPPATSASPSVTTMTGAKPGELITLRGRPSKIVWQHMMTSVPGKRSAYFDLGGGKEQTVVYWK